MWSDRDGLRIRRQPHELAANRFQGVALYRDDRGDLAGDQRRRRDVALFRRARLGVGRRERPLLRRLLWHSWRWQREPAAFAAPLSRSGQRLALRRDRGEQV